MANEVIIKSNKYGIRLILDGRTEFSELLQMIGEKFRETGQFFGDAKIAVALEGRELSIEEEQRIVDVIMDNSQIQIVCIIDQDSGLEERMRIEVTRQHAEAPQAAGTRRAKHIGRGEAAGNLPMPEPEMYGQGMTGTELTADFYRGNLRSGQVLECASSVTLIGDVNPGAKIVSVGSIVVLGSLKGNAQAGAAGDNSCFIYALDMRPIQLQIGECIAKSPDKDEDKRKKRSSKKEAANAYASRVAVVRDGMICIEPMTKRCLDTIQS